MARPATVPFIRKSDTVPEPGVGFSFRFTGQSRVLGPPLAAFPASVVEEERDRARAQVLDEPGDSICGDLYLIGRAEFLPTL